MHLKRCPLFAISNFVMLRLVPFVCLICLAFSKPQDPTLRAHDRKLSDPLIGLDELTSGHSPSTTRKDGEKLLAVASKYVDQDVSRTFDEYRNEFKTSYVTFEQHKNKISDDYEEEEDSDDGELQQTITRDKRRFEKADTDGDGKLTKDEFAAFLHPEEFEHMRDIVIDETLEDLDLNKDGRIDLEEYTKDMWVDESQSPPEWVKTEQQQFRETRDKNKDGYLDREEIRAWLFPADYDHIESELKHLMSETDDDQDGKLSKDEILSHYHVFIGSQATDFGQALYSHDEL
ncbi:calumenin [Echinococcus multilocularis]|uniref:Reticulocalbin-3 n=1 Tax=Echinococcus multilocularis TaxID=6211 RepID=A0A087W263_ECHMU|nr:calumenin [Echinococcus multilocularis]